MPYSGTNPKKKKKDDPALGDPAADVAAAPPSLEDQMTTEAGRIGAEETRRYEEGVGVLQSAYERSQAAYDDMIDPDLLYSRAADAVGARGKSVLSSMMKNMAGRGIRPSSGAAQGMMSKLALGIEGEMIGAQRDIALSNQAQRRADAAANFGQATTLASAIGSQVGGIEYENLQNLFEGQLAREGIQAGVGAQKAASKDRKMGSLGGGLLSAGSSAIK